MKTGEAEDHYKALLHEKPSFHADCMGDKVLQSEVSNWGLEPEILEWILKRVAPDSNTLETGCGYSTVVFSILGTKHVTISPFIEEHQAIQNWCNRKQISTERVDFIARNSQDAIVAMQDGVPLDLVLIDGDHAFPAPFIDWYYTAERVRPGGYVIVDDTHLITGTILRDFLKMERGRWDLITEMGKTSIFVKVTAKPVVRGLGFGFQRFCDKPKRSRLQRIKRKIGRLLSNPEDAIWRE
jgi:hypothetical protein